jgi:predicted lipoprotein
LPFTTNVSGTSSTDATNSGTTTVTLTGQGTDSVGFQIAISGPATSGGGVQMTSSQVSFGPAANRHQYTGQVTSLNGTTIQAVVTDSTGAKATLSFDLTLSGTALGGSLTASAS